MLSFLVLSPFVLAPVAAYVGGRWPSQVRWLALWPAGLALLAEHLLRTQVAVGGPITTALPWAAPLGLTLQFHADGLALVFALMITVIGALVVWYASAYLAGHRDLPRLLTALFLFMGAMLGVALSDNLFALFVFWELTGFTSYLLIGFEHDDAAARRAAMQAFVLTGAGGLALLAGATLLVQATGTTALSEMARAGDLASHPVYVWAVVLFFAAAFTKSAQVPFHFWLPGAMAAPTPISAYLHSATMVKAGVYLLARMTPVLGGTDLWSNTLLVVGGTTMVVGAWRAVQETDLKRVLAYTTVAALGALVLMIGIGTQGAAVAAIVYMIAHASYKGSLFMVVGAIDHETGTRDVTRLGGLRQKMPLTALAAALAAASMVGLPFFFGFFGKELFYEAGWTSARAPGLLLGVSVAASALMGVAALTAGVGPFVGRLSEVGERAHEAPRAMWTGPLSLAGAGVIFALAPGIINGPIGLAAAGITGAYQDVHIVLWHGFTPVLGFSALTLLLVAGLYSQRHRLRQLRPASVGSDRIFWGPLRALERVSEAVSPALYRGSIRGYVLVLIVATGGLLAAALLVGGGAPVPRGGLVPPRAFELVMVTVICVAALAAARATSSMRAVLALGTVGYGVALLFVTYGAPDLAMTQFSVETLTVVIFVLVFRMFGSFDHLSSRLVRLRDAIVAGVVGAVISALVLFVGTADEPSRLADFFAEAAPTLGHGRNVVNVILVDFRAFDTMGEITVLAVAAIGVHALLRIGAQERRNS
ncbi:MAG: proton-conducting transporter membrane subunit [Acidobacteriota bacterium]|nr:MAG: hypothetical protein DIU54_12295 [Acidobacteriota bacterium]